MIRLHSFANDSNLATGNLGTTRTVTLSNVPPGACLVYFSAWYNQTGMSSVSDGTYAFTLGARAIATAGTGIDLWYLPVSVGGNVIVSAVPSGVRYVTSGLAAFLGVARDGALRGKATRGNGVTSISTSDTNTFDATPNAGDLIVTGAGFTVSAGTITSSTGEVLLCNSASYNAGGNESGLLAYAMADGLNRARAISWTSASGYSSLAAIALRPALDFAGRRPSRPGRFRRNAY